jgi:hypothetical protein
VGGGWVGGWGGGGGGDVMCGVVWCSVVWYGEAGGAGSTLRGATVCGLHMHRLWSLVHTSPSCTSCLSMTQPPLAGGMHLECNHIMHAFLTPSTYIIARLPPNTPSTPCRHTPTPPLPRTHLDGGQYHRGVDVLEARQHPLHNLLRVLGVPGVIPRQAIQDEHLGGGQEVCGGVGRAMDGWVKGGTGRQAVFVCNWVGGQGQR